jgi:cytochrome o ubiquinol oxidase subunit 3
MSGAMPKQGVYMSDQPLATHEKTFANKYTFGFWAYIMTDCLLFASLFATYAVLHKNTAEGPGAKELFSLDYVMIETMLLLASSFTCGIAMLYIRYRQQSKAIIWLIATFVLGLAFVQMEVYEFSKLYFEGHGWQTSAFLSSYFTLVGTHGIHITVGLIWLAVMIGQLFRGGISAHNYRRLVSWSLFWHFLDIVWIFIFSVVYLMGVAN